jgi:tight adherence protein B
MRPSQGRRRVIATIFVLVAAAFLLVWGSALAAETPAMVIRDLDLSGYPKVSLTVSLPPEAAASSLAAKDFGLTENDRPIANFRLEPLNLEQRKLGIVLVLDASGSMKGKPLFDAKDAARIFIDGMKNGDRLAIISFSGAPALVADFTSDKNVLYDALNRINADSDTALYDALSLALDTTARAKLSQPNIVVLSDGADTISKHTTDQIVQAANAQKAAIYAVGLSTPDFKEAPLRDIAGRTQGRYSLAADSQMLTSVYSGLSRELHNQYRLSYTSRSNDRDIKLAVDARTATGPLTAAAGFVSPMPVRAAPKPAPAVLRAVNMPWLVPAIAGAVFIFWLVVALFTLGLMKRKSTLDDQIQFYGEGALASERRAGAHTGVLPDQPVVNRLVGAASAAAERGGFAAELQTELERAGLPLRASEFVVLHIGFTIVFGLMMALVFPGWMIRVIAVAGGSVIPFLFLKFKIRRRAAMFHAQLPDTLDLLAGALKAGYSFLQAVDTTAEETSPPIKTEFQRLVAETRLGSPIEQALDQMALRINSTSVDWTVMAVKTQREVGGNLAEILAILADTVRQRDQVGRQIQALTGEGRLSAAILIILPFALAGIMMFVNPSYIGALFGTSAGLTMLGVAGALMIVGMVWLKKIITIDV